MFYLHSNKKNYVIEIENKKKPFYKLFYNLFQIKLSKLRRYLENHFKKIELVIRVFL